MANRHYVTLMTVLVGALLLRAQGAAAAGYTITVSTDKGSYVSGDQIRVTGTVSPAPGPSTAVAVRIFGPPPTGGKPPLVAVGEAPVASSTGDYNFTFVAGGSSAWTVGTYTVNATWGAFPPAIFKTATFNFTVASTTTTTSTTTTSTAPTTSSTTTTSTTSTSSSTSPTSSSSTTTTSSTTTIVTTSSTSTTVPEFPVQAALVGIVVLVMSAAYLLVRRAKTLSGTTPLTR